MIFSARIALHPERNEKNIDCIQKEIQSIIKFQLQPRCSNVECSKVCVEIAIALPRDELQWLVMPALQCYLKEVYIAVVSNKIRWVWRVSKSGVPILEMCVGRWDRKSTAHVANSKICRISSKPTVNSIQPLFPVLAPSHHPALSSPHVHLFT